MTEAEQAGRPDVDVVLYAPDFGSVRVIECSPPSWAVQLLLAEKRVCHRVEWLSFANGEHKTPQMLARNPRGTIPVLSVGESGREISVHETFAILEYVEYLFPLPALLPSSSFERARALTRLHESALVMRLGMEVFVTSMREENTGPPDWTHLREEFARWNSYLENDGWASGDAVGLADLIVFAYLATGMRLGFELGTLANLGEYYARMLARDSVRDTWPKPWGEPPPTQASRSCHRAQNTDG